MPRHKKTLSSISEPSTTSIDTSGSLHSLIHLPGEETKDNLRGLSRHLDTLHTATTKAQKTANRSYAFALSHRSVDTYDLAIKAKKVLDAYDDFKERFDNYVRELQQYMTPSEKRQFHDSLGKKADARNGKKRQLRQVGQGVEAPNNLVGGDAEAMVLDE